MLEHEQFLRTAAIITVGKSEPAGRTNAWKVYLQDGPRASAAIFKYIDRRRPKAFPTSYHYELAAYGLSRYLGLALVPPTVERQVEGLPGSLQEYCRGVISEADRRRKDLAPADATGLQDAFSELGIFENLTSNPRLDATDILIRTSDWKVWRVDFSEAFDPAAELLPDSPFSRCSRDLYDKLRGAGDADLRAILGTYLNDEELAGLLTRKRLIVERIEALIREKGEPAVLFEK